MFNPQPCRLRVTPTSYCNSVYEYIDAARSTIPQSVCVRLPALPPSVIGSLANLFDIPGFAVLGVFLLASEIMIGRLETYPLASQQLALCPKTMRVFGLHLPIGRSVM